MKLEDPNAMVRNSFFKLTNTSIDGLSCVCRLSSKLEVKIAGYSSSFFLQVHKVDNAVHRINHYPVPG